MDQGTLALILLCVLCLAAGALIGRHFSGDA